MNEDNLKIYFRNLYKGIYREHNNIEYFTHLKEVADLVKLTDYSQDMLVASYAHDSIEDKLLTKDMLATLFNDNVANMVDDLSNKTTILDGNREQRKSIEREYLSKCSYSVKTIKLADRISNLKTIHLFNNKFVNIYVKESKLLLTALIDGSNILVELLSKEIYKHERSMS